MTELRLYILLALGSGPAHGYALGKEIQERSAGRLDPSTGALYQALKRLTDDGLVKAVAAPAGETGDARRNYFAITPAGRRELSGELQRLDDLISLARRRKLYGGSRS